eukprot:jgi/Mesen1/161/ME1132041C07613
MCGFGGGEREQEELREYRRTHFATLYQYETSGKLKGPEFYREEGVCPLTPEEAALILASLGFRRTTRIYMAGGGVYGGRGRIAMLKSLYPNLMTKEDLLSRAELASAGLVMGHRIYFGGGRAPSVRPNPLAVALVLKEAETIEWHDLEERMRRYVRQSLRALVRPTARSVYRHPRCKECMCEEAASAPPALA